VGKERKRCSEQWIIKAEKYRFQSPSVLEGFQKRRAKAGER